MRFESEILYPQKPTPQRRGYRQVDHIIIQRRKDEAEHEQMERQNNYYKIMDKKADFERATIDANRRYKLYKNYTQLKNIRREQFEERQKKLATLFEQDRIEWAKLIEESRETVFDRIQVMKDEIKVLREKREARKKKENDNALYNLWKNNCHEIRGFESKLREKETAVALEQQIKQREIARKAEMEYTKIWDALAENNRLKKIEYYNNEEQRKKNLGMYIGRCLEEQIEEINKRKQEEERLREVERQYDLERNKMIELEDKRNEMLRKQNAVATRREIEEFNKENIRRKAEEVQKELEMDLNIINELKKEMDNEKEEENKRKIKIKRDMDLFMEHINRQRQIEKERQKQIDDAYLQEYNKQNRLLYEKWKQEQIARDKLMKDVMKARQEQINEKLENNKREQEENRREMEKILENIKKYEEEKKLEEQKNMENKKQYSSDLLDQINYKRMNNEKLQKQEEEDYQRNLKQKQEYDDLLEKTKLLEQFKTKLKIAQIQKVDNSHFKQLPNPALYSTYTQDKLHDALLMREAAESSNKSE
ncbi:hypothetical protein BCR32DRAFT_273359 [Anaeromyces robustus]|uniref:Cilia- and flagella-associated protein 53 n=1 Tax=Anaeromyces robustus TaxID=1754192 RepID=A0A1Y1VSF6_9FUNG|nr:hypothetical protein BCR32DRAFT_273359 [Anaeromyces robustus]|eukprot:ORX63694.1 hypothetical protein BCR32DRAFT_273359 [Anaeromyces robustus]